MEGRKTMSRENRKAGATDKGVRTTQEILASELSYRRLFEAAQDGILILDVDTGRVNDVNPFLSWLLGFSREEMIGKTVGELSPFKDIESNQAMLERLQEQGYVRYENLPLESRDGRKMAVEFVSNVYQAGDRKVIQCNVRDITERKKAEAELRRAQRLESVGTLAGGIAHDLNNILSPIMMSIDILKNLSDNPQALKILKTLEVNAQRGADIVKQILSLASGLEGEGVADPEASSGSANAVALPRGNGEMVLVVDDEASILTITSQTLQAFGYRVLTAHHGADAVALYAQHRNDIAVVLTDMMMPVMDGLAMAKVLRKINPAVRIVGSSGLHANSSVAKAGGIEHFLPKPYSPETLLKIMRAIIVMA